MGQTPLERLERLRGSCLAGWARVRSNPAERACALVWLARHPSSEPAVDYHWRAALLAEGALATWLEGGADLSAWPLELPCHTVLASHPFASLPPWSIPLRSRVS